MSGGSGSGVYDPVTTTDVQFGDADDRHCKFQVRGGRIYNFGTYKKSGIKAVCDEIRNRSRPKCLFIVFVTTLVLILMMLAIVIAASHKRDKGTDPAFEAWTNKSNGNPASVPIFETWSNRSNGLVFVPYGLDKSVHIHIKLEEENVINALTGTLEEVTKDYQILKQQSAQYVDCNSTYAPQDKVCKQPLSSFGKYCSREHRWGYTHGQPCVLLQLRLPQDVTVRSTRPKDGDLYVQAEKSLGNRTSVSHVGVSCEPASPADAKNFYEKSHFGDTIQYFPAEGFPTYVYRKRTTDEFLTPAVMVWFTSLRDLKPTRINCKTWGVFENDKRERLSQDLYSTSFVLHID
ncbi:hypothetical protein BaRGS_00016737 [Batillaria attramentaria]|uniref:Uncharacterized protein n=1 Tax=Batillaria attramentaria TaxID=370345 RepID=A0ABD0KY39_9CAEN